jgi:hypothetical protein
MKKNTILLVVLMVSLLTINVKAEEATAPTLSKNHLTVSVGYGSRDLSFEDPDFPTLDTEGDSAVKLELSYLRSITDKFRVGVSFLSGTSYKGDLVFIDQDINRFSTFTSTDNIALETKDNGSVNLLLEYDFYSVNKFTFFASTQIGISMYSSTNDTNYNVIETDNATGAILDDNVDSDSYSQTESTTGLNYGLAVGANYAINDKLTLTNKLGYNLKSNIDALTYDNGTITEGQFSGEASYLVGLRYSF